MAQVPYNPVPRGQPITETPQVRINIEPDAFGVNIGRALSARGGAMETFGNDVYAAGQSILKTYNEFDARNKLVDYEQETGTEKANFDALPDGQKMNSLLAHQQRLRDIHDKYVGQVGSIDGKMMFLRESQPFLGRNIFTSAAEAGHSWNDFQYKEGMANVRKTGMSLSSASDAEIDSKSKAQDDAIDAVAPYGSLGPEQVALLKKQTHSQTIMNGAMHRADRGDVQGAFEFLEGRFGNKEITDDDYQKAYNHVGSALVSKQSTTDAEKLFQSGISADSAHKWIEDHAKTVTTNENLQSALIEATKNKYDHQSVYTKSIEDQQKHHSDQDIWELLNQRDPNSPTGYKINSVKDFRSDPKFNAIFNGMDDKGQATLDAGLELRIQGRNIETNRQTFQALKGEADEAPQRFLQRNLMDKNLPLSWDDRMKLLATRRQVLRDPAQNRDTQMASSWMLNDKYGGAVASLNLNRMPGADATQAQKDEFFRYKGILREGMEAWRENHDGKAPTREEFIEKIAPNVLKEHTSMFDWIGGKPYYTLEGEAARKFPDAAVNEAREVLTREAIKNNMPSPTDADAQEYLMLKNWHLLLDVQGGKSGGTKPAGSTGPAGPSVPNQ